MTQEEILNTPVYMKPFFEARDADETQQYHTSHALNQECMNALCKLIGEGYHDNHLSHDIGRKLLSMYGTDRVTAVLSNLLQNYQWDQRYSAVNQKWAKKFPLPDDSGWRNYNYTQAHSGLVNLVVNQIREELEQLKAPSLSDRLAAAKEAVQQQNAGQGHSTPSHSHEQNL
jgi:alcohol dehydrogenase YqhD (iron-dependent ADH family)